MSSSKLHQATIFIIVGILYSYLLTFYYQPLEFILLSVLATFILSLSSPTSTLTYITSLPIYKWLLFYLVITLIWIILPNSHSTYGEMRTLMLSIIILFTMTTLLHFDDNNLTITRKAILLVTFLAVFNNAAEFLNPSIFGNKHKILGRSAGFYLNANIAGEAILLGMIFSIGLIWKGFKVVFLFICLLGIIATFSRTAIASWFIIVFIMSLTKLINKKDSITVIATLFVTASILIPILINFINVNLEGATENLLTRLDFFSGKSFEIDESEKTRIAIAESALSYFIENPLLGGGLNLTLHWEHPVSTHNMYLLHMAERGLIGIFIYPLLLLSVAWKAQGEAKKTAFAFITYVFIIGFTTHNILDAYHILISFALMASWSYRSHNLNERKSL